MGAKKIDWLNDPDVEQYWTIYQFNRQWVYTMWPTNASFLFIIMKQLWTYLAHLEVTCLTSLFYFLVHMNYFISHSFMSIPIFLLLFFCIKLIIQTSVYLTLITMYQIMFQHTNLKTKTVLTKFTMRNMGSIIDHISGTIYH